MNWQIEPTPHQIIRRHQLREPVPLADTSIYNESFNGRLRDELLNETLFRSLPHVRAVLEDWRRDDNEQRQHSKLGWMTPRAFARGISGQTGDRATQPEGSARTPFGAHHNEGSNQPRTLVMAG